MVLLHMAAKVPACCAVSQASRDVAFAVALARCDVAAAVAAVPGGGGSLAAYEELRAAARLLEEHRVGPTLLAEVLGAIEVRKDHAQRCSNAGRVIVFITAHRVSFLCRRDASKGIVLICEWCHLVIGCLRVESSHCCVALQG